MTCSPTSTPTATPCATSCAAAATDVLARLESIVERTPAGTLVTHPLHRTLLAEACTEIRRLRAENQHLLTRKDRP